MYITFIITSISFAIHGQCHGKATFFGQYFVSISIMLFSTMVHILVGKGYDEKQNIYM